MSPREPSCTPTNMVPSLQQQEFLKTRNFTFRTSQRKEYMGFERKAEHFSQMCSGLGNQRSKYQAVQGTVY